MSTTPFDHTDKGMIFYFNYKCITELGLHCNQVRRITVQPVIKASQTLTRSVLVLI